jgi:hypothetical protein
MSRSSGEPPYDPSIGVLRGRHAFIFAANHGQL